MNSMSGQVHGLHYPALEAVLRMLGTRDRRQVFVDVQVMEAEVLAVVNRK